MKKKITIIIHPDNMENSPSPQKISKQIRRQYNLVYRIRKKGHTVNTKEKTIYCRGVFLPDELKMIDELRREFKFFLQLELKYS